MLRWCHIHGRHILMRSLMLVHHFSQLFTIHACATDVLSDTYTTVFQKDAAGALNPSTVVSNFESWSPPLAARRVPGYLRPGRQCRCSIYPNRSRMPKCPDNSAPMPNCLDTSAPKFGPEMSWCRSVLKAWYTPKIGRPSIIRLCPQKSYRGQHCTLLGVIFRPCGRINVKHRRYFPSAADEKNKIKYNRAVFRPCWSTSAILTVLIYCSSQLCW